VSVRPSAAEVAPPLTDLGRLSFNQITADQLTLEQAIEACADAGIEWIGPWRHKLDDRSAERIRDAGLRVSSLCRGGFFPAASESERRERDADNRRAVEQAAELDTDVLVLVCGGAPGSELGAARAQVADGIERLAPFAADHGVRLAIEPLHPMMVVERSVIVTLGQANQIAARFDPERVGVVVDAYHVWWDPELERELERARGRIYGYHVSDWLVPTTNLLAGRGMMGDGAIDLRRLRALVEAAGYEGPIEVEVINEELAEVPGRELVATVCERYLAHV
jgi:sugar phosphate isomerase/epimerase